MQKLERLSKIMASRGICSRREADKYIERGLVLVNNKIIDQLGSKVANLSERIDGGGSAGNIADHKLDAMEALARCNTAVGPTSADVLDLVCGKGYSISDLNRIMKWSKNYGGHRLREALGEAAVHFGLVSKGNTIRG